MCGCGCSESDPGNKVRQYAVKLVCGVVGSKQKDAIPPNVQTLVNIHNPSVCSEVTLHWKIATASLFSKESGKITDFQELTLAPDAATQFPCRELLASVKLGNAPFDGWLVIECEDDLDVVALYHTFSSVTGEIASTTMERVPCRLHLPCEDARFNLSTGTALWTSDGEVWLHSPKDQLRADPSFNSVGIPMIQGWGPLLDSSGNETALWLYDPTQKPGEVRHYQICFSLCFGFKLLNSTVRLLASDAARVKLNGVDLIGGFLTPTHPWHSAPNTSAETTPATLSIPASALKAGVNCLTVEVLAADKNAAGFALEAGMLLAKGMCPGQGIPKIPCPEVSYNVSCKKGKASSGANGSDACCDAKIGHGKLNGFSVQLTGNVPNGMHVVYQGQADEDYFDGGHNPPHLIGPAKDGVLIKGNTSKPEEVLEEIQIRLINAPLHCNSISYVVDYNHIHANDMGSNWQAVGKNNESIGCIKVNMP